MAWRFLGFVLTLLVFGILGSLSVTAVFAVFGLVLWMASGEIGVLWLCLGFGAFVGFLLGVGNGVTLYLEEWLRGPEHVVELDEETQAPLQSGAPHMMLFLAGAVGGLWQLILAIGSLVLWLFGSHRQAKAPARKARIVFATLFMTVFGALFTLVTHLIVAPKPPHGLPIWQVAAFVIPTSAVIGFLLGAASRDW